MNLNKIRDKLIKTYGTKTLKTVARVRLGTRATVGHVFPPYSGFLDHLMRLLISACRYEKGIPGHTRASRS